jgi:RNA polymerase sigma-70 factor (ECF subfamily)
MGWMEDAAREQSILGHLAREEWDRAATAAILGYGPHVLGYLIALVHDRELGRELFAETCERLWRGLPSFRRDGSFRGWTYRIAWNVAQDHFRHPERRRLRRLATTEISSVVESVRSATPRHLRSSVKSGVAALRAQLSPEEQTLLTLRLDRELGWDEIGGILEAEPAALRKRFQRLKDKLRTLARASGLLGPDP